MSTKVFVTYAHSTAGEANVVEAARSLTTMGLDVWLDKDQMQPGESIKEKTSKAIESADYVIAFVGEGDEPSKWVTWEIKEAFKKNKRVVPVIFGETKLDKLPEILKDRYAIRARSGLESAQLIYSTIDKERSFWSKVKEYLANG